MLAKPGQVAAVLDELAWLAWREAKHSFQIPGLGVITLAERPARQVVMRFGPKAGQTVTVPVQVLRFRFTKAAKDAIWGVKKDNLEIIEGIGPQIADVFYQAGILTFQQLADTPVEKLRQILNDANYIADPTTGPQ